MLMIGDESMKYTSNDEEYNFGDQRIGSKGYFLFFTINFYQLLLIC